MLERLERLVGVRDGYSVGRHNCRMFSNVEFDDVDGVELDPK